MAAVKDQLKRSLRRLQSPPTLQNITNCLQSARKRSHPEQFVSSQYVYSLPIVDVQ